MRLYAYAHGISYFDDNGVQVMNCQEGKVRGELDEQGQLKLVMVDHEGTHWGENGYLMGVPDGAFFYPDGTVAQVRLVCCTPSRRSVAPSSSPP